MPVRYAHARCKQSSPAQPCGMAGVQPLCKSPRCAQTPPPASRAFHGIALVYSCSPRTLSVSPKQAVGDAPPGHDKRPSRPSAPPNMRWRWRPMRLFAVLFRNHFVPKTSKHRKKQTQLIDPTASIAPDGSTASAKQQAPSQANRPRGIESENIGSATSAAPSRPANSENFDAPRFVYQIKRHSD